MLKIFKTFKEVSGITGFNKIEIFLINSKAVNTIVFNHILSYFFFQGSWSLKYLLDANNDSIRKFIYSFIF